MTAAAHNFASNLRNSECPPSIEGKSMAVLFNNIEIQLLQYIKKEFIS